jgi:two-component system sensor histidine kinase KdpD
MERIILNKLQKLKQYLYGILSVMVVSAICYLLSAFMGYKIVALLLLFTVSVLAMFLDIFPVLLIALLSALIWDFFFIPPIFTLRISQTDDVLMFLMYFIIALVNAVLNYKTRQWEKIVRKREETQNTLTLYNTLLNSLSHELRTPISTIIAATDNLQTNSAQLTAQDKNELVHEISAASLRLNQQVENLLNMSRLEAGVIQPKKDWTDINELVYEVIKRVEENKITHKIIVNIAADIPLFYLDKVMIEQVIYNLLNNAVIYTPATATIIIHANAVADRLSMVVEDTGNGFPEDEINKVFQKFYRLKNSKAGGTGLGLSIAKGFVEAHNGIIGLQNSVPQGAKFMIEIPTEMSYLKNLKNE